MKKNLTYLTLVLSTLFWGCNFNLGKYAMRFLHPLDVAAWRFIIATVAMVAVLLLTEGVDRGALKRNWLTYIVMGLLGVFGFNALWCYGLSLTSPLNGSLIMALNPTLTVTLSALVFRERIQPRQVLGLMVSFTGVLVVTLHASLAALSSLKFSFGDLMILGSNVCWAVNSIVGKRFLKASSAIQTTAMSMLVGSVCLVAVASGASHPLSFVDQSTHVIGAVAFMGLLGSVLAYVFWNNGITVLGAAKTSVFFDLIPIWTMIVTILGGESIPTTQWIGSALVVLGVLFSSGFSLRPTPEAVDATAEPVVAERRVAGA